MWVKNISCFCFFCITIIYFSSIFYYFSTTTSSISCSCICWPSHPADLEQRLRLITLGAWEFPTWLGCSIFTTVVLPSIFGVTFYIWLAQCFCLWECCAGIFMDTGQSLWAALSLFREDNLNTHHLLFNLFQVDWYLRFMHLAMHEATSMVINNNLTIISGSFRVFF